MCIVVIFFVQQNFDISIGFKKKVFIENIHHFCFFLDPPPTRNFKFWNLPETQFPKKFFNQKNAP